MVCALSLSVVLAKACLLSLVITSSSSPLIKTFTINNWDNGRPLFCSYPGGCTSISLNARMSQDGARSFLNIISTALDDTAYTFTSRRFLILVWSKRLLASWSCGSPWCPALHTSKNPGNPILVAAFVFGLVTLISQSRLGRPITCLI